MIRNAPESVTIWSQSRLLRNNLVRSQQQRLWDGQPEGLGGFEIDHQLELRRLLHGQVAELRALEDLVHVRGRAAAVAGALSGRIVVAIVRWRHLLEGRIRVCRNADGRLVWG